MITIGITLIVYAVFMWLLFEIVNNIYSRKQKRKIFNHWKDDSLEQGTIDLSRELTTIDRMTMMFSILTTLTALWTVMLGICLILN